MTKVSINKVYDKMKTSYKGETNMKDKRQKMTLLLDDATIKLLRQYGMNESGNESVSNAVRMMARKYGKQLQQEEQGK